ncbi:hypothetical protein SLE2022_221310 [Rubroshorea leprosula]
MQVRSFKTIREEEECLCVLVVDDTEEIAAAAHGFMEYLFSSTGKRFVEHGIAEIFSRLVESLPKMVLGSDESLALSHAQQLLAVIYYSGPLFVSDHLQSPILGIFALCLSQSSTFTGSLYKLVSARPSSIGYLRSVDELKAGLQVTSYHKTLLGAASSKSPKRIYIQEDGMQDKTEIIQKNYKLPRMPPWFVYVGSQKLYQALAGTLRLVGLSLMTDFKTEGHLSVITDIPLGYLRKLVSEVRVKEYNKESWLSWYNRIGSGQLLRQSSNAACILHEMIFGLSEHSIDDFRRIFQESRMKRVDFQNSREESAGSQAHEFTSSMLDDYHKAPVMQSDAEVEDITPHFFRDTAMLHQEIKLFFYSIFALCLGRDFASSGFLHSSLYLLLENLIRSNFDIRSASDSVLHLLSSTSGHSSVGELVLANADYVIDSICRQLRHLDLNPHAPNVLAAMLSYIGVDHKILPLLEEPMHSVSQELEILGRHKHPDLTIPFLKAVAEIAKASKHEACSLLPQAESYLMHIKSKISDMEKKAKSGFQETKIDMSFVEMDLDQWENMLFKLNHSKSCNPYASFYKSSITLGALDIVEDGIATLAKVEEAKVEEGQKPSPSPY